MADDYQENVAFIGVQNWSQSQKARVRQLAD